MDRYLLAVGAGITDPRTPSLVASLAAGSSPSLSGGRRHRLPRPPRPSPKSSKSHAQLARGSRDHVLVYIEGLAVEETLPSSLDGENGRLICIVPRIDDMEVLSWS
jgi:hypothetical protein